MSAKLLSLMWEKAKRNPEFFLLNFYWTLDEHADAKGLAPIRLLPEKDYIVKLIDQLHTNDRIVIPKSRQMMITWTVCGYCLWDALFKTGRKEFYVSRKEDIAKEMINRNKISYKQLAANIPAEWLPQSTTFGAAVGDSLTLPFPGINSSIKALPQGSDSLRHFTASIIFMDEAAFQEQARSVFIGAKPTLDGGGKMVIASTSNGKDGHGKFFYQVAHDVG